MDLDTSKQIHNTHLRPLQQQSPLGPLYKKDTMHTFLTEFRARLMEVATQEYYKSKIVSK